MNQSYLCIDLKSYYASVECVDRGLDPFTANLVVAESDRELGGADAPFAGWTQVRVKRYGRAFVTFLQR